MNTLFYVLGYESVVHRARWKLPILIVIESRGSLGRNSSSMYGKGGQLEELGRTDWGVWLGINPNLEGGYASLVLSVPRTTSSCVKYNTTGVFLQLGSLGRGKYFEPMFSVNTCYYCSLVAMSSSYTQARNTSMLAGTTIPLYHGVLTFCWYSGKRQLTLRAMMPLREASRVKVCKESTPIRSIGCCTEWGSGQDIQHSPRTNLTLQ